MYVNPFINIGFLLDIYKINLPDIATGKKRSIPTAVFVNGGNPVTYKANTSLRKNCWNACKHVRP